MIRRGFYVRPDGLAGIDKVPAETEDYTLDWADELRDGTAIIDAAWAVPAGLTGGAANVTGTKTTKQLAGGTVGTEYKVVCTITKSGGVRVVPRTIVVTVVADLS